MASIRTIPQATALVINNSRQMDNVHRLWPRAHRHREQPTGYQQHLRISHSDGIRTASKNLRVTTTLWSETLSTALVAWKHESSTLSSRGAMLIWKPMRETYLSTTVFMLSAVQLLCAD